MSYIKPRGVSLSDLRDNYVVASKHPLAPLWRELRAELPSFQEGSAILVPMPDGLDLTPSEWLTRVKGALAKEMKALDLTHKLVFGLAQKTDDDGNPIGQEEVAIQYPRATIDNEKVEDSAA